jgi:NADH:ubiquinone reductase (H+-translocating)
MAQNILIVGGGFAGVWAALAAARALDEAGKNEQDIEITLISPKPALEIRPRLYEPSPHELSAPIVPLLTAVGVKFIEGVVERIHGSDQCVDVLGADGGRCILPYDRLVLTSGSKLYRPGLPGVVEHTLSVDQLDDAVALDQHLAALAQLPESPERNTVVVVGAGFTGLEIATELPARLRAVFGADAAVQVIMVEQAADVGPDLGPGPRPVILEALDSLGIKSVLGSGVASVDAGGVVTASGQRIAAKTVVWSGGMRASSLTEQVPSKRDRFGRMEVTRDLRVIGASNVYAAGDVALAATDDVGNVASMSCQHALFMGRFAGNNAVADLLGQATLQYEQPAYVTCLDLGEWGAVFTEGWDRQVKMTGDQAKQTKRAINTQWIYPPVAERAAGLEAGKPRTAF